MTAPVSPVSPPNAAADATAAGFAEQAIQWIAKNEYFAFLGEKKIRAIATATDKVESTYGLGIFNEGRWMTPAFRKAMLQVLDDDLQQISETYAWMVVRRYRELKRYFKEKAELEAKRIRDEEAKAKAAAEKAAKAAAAAAAKAKAAPAAGAAAPGPATNPAAGPAPSVPAPAAGAAETAAAAAKNAGVPAGIDGKLHSPPQKDPAGSDPKKDGSGPG